MQTSIFSNTLVEEAITTCALNLSDRQIARIPAEIFAFGGLIQLDLSGNCLFHLPPEIEQLVTLQCLNLSFNRFTSIPFYISSLKCLVSISLSYNQLDTLPDELCLLPFLEEIEANDNQIVSLPFSLAFSSSLRVLNLRYNRIQKLPVALAVNPSRLAALASFFSSPQCNTARNNLESEFTASTTLQDRENGHFSPPPGDSTSFFLARLSHLDLEGNPLPLDFLASLTHVRSMVIEAHNNNSKNKNPYREVSSSSGAESCFDPNPNSSTLSHLPDLPTLYPAAFEDVEVYIRFLSSLGSGFPGCVDDTSTPKGVGGGVGGVGRGDKSNVGAKKGGGEKGREQKGREDEGQEGQGRSKGEEGGGKRKGGMCQREAEVLTLEEGWGRRGDGDGMGREGEEGLGIWSTPDLMATMDADEAFDLKPDEAEAQEERGGEEEGEGWRRGEMGVGGEKRTRKGVSEGAKGDVRNPSDKTFHSNGAETSKTRDSGEKYDGGLFAMQRLQKIYEEDFQTLPLSAASALIKSLDLCAIGVAEVACGRPLSRGGGEREGGRVASGSTLGSDVDLNPGSESSASLPIRPSSALGRLSLASRGGMRPSTTMAPSAAAAAAFSCFRGTTTASSYKSSWDARIQRPSTAGSYSAWSERASRPSVVLQTMHAVHNEPVLRQSVGQILAGGAKGASAAEVARERGGSGLWSFGRKKGEDRSEDGGSNNCDTNSTISNAPSTDYGLADCRTSGKGSPEVREFVDGRRLPLPVSSSTTLGSSTAFHSSLFSDPEERHRLDRSSINADVVVNSRTNNSRANNSRANNSRTNDTHVGFVGDATSLAAVTFPLAAGVRSMLRRMERRGSPVAEGRGSGAGEERDSEVEEKGGLHSNFIADKCSSSQIRNLGTTNGDYFNRGNEGKYDSISETVATLLKERRPSLLAALGEVLDGEEEGEKMEETDRSGEEMEREWEEEGAMEEKVGEEENVIAGGISN